MTEDSLDRRYRRLLRMAAILPLLMIGLLFTLRWTLGRTETLPVLWNVPAFTLLDQDSTPFSSTELTGRIWLASFVYTNCPDVCPMVTARMAALRDSLQQQGRLGDVRLFSITVDPLRDTPAVLREYGAKFRASKPDWVFLTGPLATIVPLVNEGFRLSLMHPHARAQDTTHAHETDYMVNHTDRIVLIDRESRVRGTYESTDPAALARLRADLRRLK